MNTRLPSALSVPYCEGSLTAEVSHNHDHLTPDMAKAASRLDNALEDIELILKDTPSSDTAMRRKLERIHADIAKSKRAIEK